MTEFDADRVDRQFAPYESRSLTRLLGAATDSPGCSHRQISLALLWQHSVVSPPGGHKTASVRDLRSLLATIGDACPNVALLEDCWNPDPRFAVRFLWGPRRQLFHPGQMSNPVESLRMVGSVAAAVDQHLVERNGFGIGDLLDAALQYSDRLLSPLVPAWPAVLKRDEPEPEEESLSERIDRIRSTPIRLNRQELSRYRPIQGSGTPWLDDCLHPDRARLAWVWATREADQAAPELAIDTDLWGSALALRHRNRTVPVPAAFVIGALCHAAAELCAGAREIPLHLFIRKATAQRAAWLAGLPMPSIPDDPAEALDVLAKPDVILMGQSPRRTMLIGFAAGVTEEGVRQSVEDTIEVLSEVNDHLSTEQTVEVAPGASISRVVICGGPFHLGRLCQDGVALVHVEDFVSMLHEAQECEGGDPMSGVLVWQYFHEVSTTPALERATIIDTESCWQGWLEHGVFDFGDDPEAEVLILARTDDLRWTNDAKWEPFDEVLYRAEIRPHWQWPTATLEEDENEARIGSHDENGYVVLDPPLVALATKELPPDALEIDTGALFNVLGAIMNTISMCSGLRSAVTMDDGSSLLIRLQALPGDLSGRQNTTGIQGRVTKEPPWAIEISIGGAWFAHIRTNPTAAHKDLGSDLLM